MDQAVSPRNAQSVASCHIQTHIPGLGISTGRNNVDHGVVASYYHDWHVWALQTPAKSQALCQQVGHMETARF